VDEISVGGTTDFLNAFRVGAMTNSYFEISSRTRQSLLTVSEAQLEPADVTTDIQGDLLTHCPSRT